MPQRIRRKISSVYVESQLQEQSFKKHNIFQPCLLKEKQTFGHSGKATRRKRERQTDRWGFQHLGFWPYCISPALTAGVVLYVCCIFILGWDFRDLILYRVFGWVHLGTRVPKARSFGKPTAKNTCMYSHGGTLPCTTMANTHTHTSTHEGITAHACTTI